MLWKVQNQQNGTRTKHQQLGASEAKAAGSAEDMKQSLGNVDHRNLEPMSSLIPRNHYIPADPRDDFRYFDHL